jgi:hypothetical protein
MSPQFVEIQVQLRYSLNRLRCRGAEIADVGLQISLVPALMGRMVRCTPVTGRRLEWVMGTQGRAKSPRSALWSETGHHVADAVCHNQTRAVQ